jgi:alkanesulfonate monooxygenase SsuD/methylene tetrahydromethanopterin reductase-like flavin-dependent oxidoreductase (luciferase family)
VPFAAVMASTKEERVRFTYAEAMTDPTFYVPLAKAAEAAGYDAMTIADSVAYPYESDSKYPYTADGSREFLDGKAFVEAFVLAGALSAVTTTMRFNFFVLKLPIRPPALVAKQAGSLAAVFGNRLGLGVGTSPWPEDYELMGVPFAKRGKRMDECIEIIRGLTSGDYFEFHGEFYDIPKTKMTPAPTEPIPILIGGHADAALRRAARCDGWMHGGGSPEELDALLVRLNQFREEQGQTGPFEIHVISGDGFTVDGVKRLEDKGVTDVIVGFRIPYIMGTDTEPLDKKIRRLEKFAERVVAKVNASGLPITGPQPPLVQRCDPKTGSPQGKCPQGRCSPSCRHRRTRWLHRPHRGRTPAVHRCPYTGHRGRFPSRPASFGSRCSAARR